MKTHFVPRLYSIFYMHSVSCSGVEESCFGFPLYIYVQHLTGKATCIVVMCNMYPAVTSHFRMAEFSKRGCTPARFGSSSREEAISNLITNRYYRNERYFTDRDTYPGEAGEPTYIGA